MLNAALPQRGDGQQRPTSQGVAESHVGKAFPAHPVDQASGHIRSVATTATRYPSLDGLRAVAIGFVMVSHALFSAQLTSPALTWLWHFDIGHLGVRIFFVLSGFLITTLLMRENEGHGRVSLKQFYLRRAFRILPAYYVYLAVVVVAGALGAISVPAYAVLRAATFTSNYDWGGSWYVLHTWSLSVEEQFYIAWPALFALLGKRMASRFALATVIAVPILRLVAMHTPHWPNEPRYAFETIADALATGCLLAIWRNRLWQWAPYRVAVMRWVPLALLPTLIAVSYLTFSFADFGAAVGATALNGLCVLGMDWSMRNPDGIIGRLLNSRIVAGMGVLSYSLYLWQQPFLAPNSHLSLAASLIATVTLAGLSYVLVEQPMLRLRKRVGARPR